MFPFRFGLFALRLGGRFPLRFLSIALDLSLTLLRRDFVLQTLAFELGFRPLLGQFGFVASLLGLGGVTLRLGLSLRLSLLQTTLAGQFVVTHDRSRGFLRLPGELAQRPAGGSLGVLLTGQVIQCSLLGTSACCPAGRRGPPRRAGRPPPRGRRPYGRFGRLPLVVGLRAA